ncbi:hypothetical protein GDO78_009143 [Eleutherodactylus coqui]|uniref:Uncharacterized protein n=1 Tax=Eleutherodactylus coqui TaxID=57060 RepID=A0A8J6F958_ELECQ|nr:hypothetical protein GDO78_009143 [Eleutherodactylus coqui]
MTANRYPVTKGCNIVNNNTFCLSNPITLPFLVICETFTPQLNITLHHRVNHYSSTGYMYRYNVLLCIPYTDFKILSPIRWPYRILLW